MLREIFIYTSAFIGLFAVIFYTLSIRGRREFNKKFVFNEKKAPFVSIVIPAYNEEKGMKATMESALGIDYPRDRLEIIVVDDGSKDRTLEIAKRYSSRLVKVYHKKNGGKGTALNYGIKRSKGEFIITMDADSIVKPDAVKHQIAKFANPKVMCVSPIVAIYEPKGILQRIQQVEYFLGIFLREAFTSVNAVHVTPGAFSAYRREFFEKHGYFEEDNLVEDFEMALRIQSKDYIIENSMKSIVYTIPPNNLKALHVQRKRWYIGLIRNLCNYTHLFSKNYGALGLLVLPIAIVTIFISIILTLNITLRSLLDLKKELMLLDSINFNFLSTYDFSKYAIERFLFNFLSDPIMLFLVLFTFILLGYMVFAKTKVKKHSAVKFSLPLFIMFYSFLFAFWWFSSIITNFISKSIKWR